VTVPEKKKPCPVTDMSSPHYLSSFSPSLVFMVPSISSHLQWHVGVQLLSPPCRWSWLPSQRLPPRHQRDNRAAPSHGFAPPAPGHGSSLVPLPSRQPPHLLPHCSSARSCGHVSNGSTSATNARMRAPEPPPLSCAGQPMSRNRVGVVPAGNLRLRVVPACRRLGPP
jgi:hypothetical protein